MGTPAIKIENVSKLYRLGLVGTRTLTHDINRWWYRVRGKEDPYLKIGQKNRRSEKGNAEFVWALRDVTIDVKEGEILGIIGENGAGKSTLLKILSRVTTPTQGRVMMRGRVGSLLEVGTGFHPELTGRENIFLNGAILGMSKTDIEANLDEIVEFSGCGMYIDTPVKRYSSGMYVRLAFSVAAHLKTDILIVDEVLAVGDVGFQERCMTKMNGISREGRTVLFVSHNLGAISQLCSRAVVLSEGMVNCEGDVRIALEKYLASSEKTPHGYRASGRTADGPTTAVFTEVTCAEFNGFEKYDFKMDERIRINMNVMGVSQHAGEVLSVAVMDNIGNRIFTTERSTSTIGIDPSGKAVGVIIPSGVLTPGRYQIRVALHVPNSMIVDEIGRAAVFNVHDVGSVFSKYGGGYGCVFVECSWIH